MEIVLLDAETLGPDIDLSCLEKFGDFTSYQRTQDQEQAKQRCLNADIILANKVLVNKDLIDACPKIKLVCVTATGLNNVDLEYTKEKNIVVKNVADYSTNSVTQHTFATLFFFMQKLDYYDNFVKSGKYSKLNTFVHYGPLFHEMSGKTFGIIGMGNIGRAVAKVADAFSAKVVYYSSSGKDRSAHFLRFSLEELLQQSDFVSVHAPLNDKTLNLIQKQQLQQMKKTAILINMGRGGIINEEDLAWALEQEEIAGAILDVFVSEPLLRENPLLQIKNKDKILFTPHIAWASIEARKLLVQKVCQNIEDFLQKE